jgi:hypothetical protein
MQFWLYETKHNLIHVLTQSSKLHLFADQNFLKLRFEGQADRQELE